MLDPVMVATSGARLLESAALDAMRSRLLPMASLITPNLPEAELLLGEPIPDRAAMRAACDTLRQHGARAVLLKGGHLHDDGEVVDLFSGDAADVHGLREIAHARLRVEAHGTGCTLASAVAANLCLSLELGDACAAAADYVHAALRDAYRPGRGDVVVLDHFGAMPRG